MGKANNIQNGNGVAFVARAVGRTVSRGNEFGRFWKVVSPQLEPANSVYLQGA
jgi:hypothetical protein